MTFIAWKSDHVVRSDVDGNINVWDVKVNIFICIRLMHLVTILGKAINRSNL